MGMYTDGQARVLSATPNRVELSGTGVTTLNNVAVGDLFRFQADTPSLYEVGAIIDATHFTLTAPYVGSKPFDADFPYLVARDFTPSFEFAELAAGDVDIREIVTYNFRLLDVLLGSAGGGGGGGTSEFPVGTRMVFDQDTAPVGWTRDTTINDRVLMVVSGARSHGGSWTISGVQIGSHQHVLPFSLTRQAGGSYPTILSIPWTSFGVGGADWNPDLYGSGPTIPIADMSPASGVPTNRAATLSGPASGSTTSDGTWRPLSRKTQIAVKD